MALQPKLSLGLPQFSSPFIPVLRHSPPSTHSHDSPCILRYSFLPSFPWFSHRSFSKYFAIECFWVIYHPLIIRPAHRSFCSLMKSESGGSLYCWYISWLYLILQFSFSLLGPRIRLRIFLSMVSSLFIVFSVKIHASLPYVSIGLTIVLYTLSLVSLWMFLERNTWESEICFIDECYSSVYFWVFRCVFI